MDALKRSPRTTRRARSPLDTADDVGKIADGAILTFPAPTEKPIALTENPVVATEFSIAATGKTIVPPPRTQRFALSGDGRHKWRPNIEADGENCHTDDGKTDHDACRTTTKTVERKRRGAII